MSGVNAELGPWVHMTAPDPELNLSSLPLGEVGFRSWLLLLGLLPFDRHGLALVEVEPRRFLERSSSWLHRVWEHERLLEAVPGGTRVTDRLVVEPRVPGSGVLVGPIVGAVFRHRHRQLRRRHGGLEISAV